LPFDILTNDKLEAARTGRAPDLVKALGPTEAALDRLKTAAPWRTGGGSAAGGNRFRKQALVSGLRDAQAASPAIETKMKFISFSFDDGFRQSGSVGTRILDRFGFKGTFYVVTGWVEPAQTAITDRFNKGASHGDWQFWRDVSQAGHEVGSHGFSHINAGDKRARFLPWIMTEQVRRSADDLTRHVPAQSYTISMPWNATSRISRYLVRQRYAACRLGSSALRYNELGGFDAFGLESWAVGAEHSWEVLSGAVKRLPENCWLIFQFHSFGHEGWAPISAAAFEDLCALVADDDIEVATVRDVVRREGAASKPIS
jgi:peptidoglycan/xylan/chitin deacetylase (PgdA/CDA1 family)